MMKTRILSRPLVLAVGLIFSLLVFGCGGSRAPIDNVYLILIDGVRPDSLEAAVTPNLDALRESGAYTANAWTVWPSNTLAAVPALHTGAPPEVHGVRDWEDEIRAQTLSEVFRAAGKTAAVVRQSGIISNYSADHTTGIYYHPEGDYHFTDLAIALVEEHSPFFLSLYYPRPDSRGHRYGHESRQYIEAIEEADYHLGRFFDFLKEKGLFDNALIVITTDHGMTGRRHGLGRDTDMRIFSVWHGPLVRKGFVVPDTVGIPAAGPVRVEIREVTDDGWSAEDVSWMNQPPVGDAIDYADVEALGWQSWDLTEYARRSSPGPINLAKTAGQTGHPRERESVFFSTREWRGNHSYLEIDYALPDGPTRNLRIFPELEVFVTEEDPEESFDRRPNYYIGTFRRAAGAAFLRFPPPGISPDGRIEKATLFSDCWRLYPAGNEDDVNISHTIIDIAPTITYLTGMPAPARSEGRVIFELIEE